MSICNVVLTGRSVLIGVDTGAGYVDCVPQEHRRVSNGNSATKLWPLTSVNCLLAGRGQCSIVPAIAHMASAAIAAQGMAFDELCEALPDMLDEAVAVTRAHMLGSGLPGDMVAQLVDHGNEVSIAGWSMKLGRMAASSFWNCSDGKGVQRLDLACVDRAAVRS